MKTTEQRQLRRSSVFTVDFEQLSHILAFPLFIPAGQ